MAGTAANTASLTSTISRTVPSQIPTLQACLEHLVSVLQLQPGSHSYVNFWPLTNDRSVWSKAQKDWLVPRHLSSDPSEVYRAQHTIGTFELTTSPTLISTFRLLTQMVILSDGSTAQGCQISLGMSTTCQWADAVQTVLDIPGNRAILGSEVRAGSWMMSGGTMYGVVLTTGWQGEASTSVIRPGQTVGAMTNPGEAVLALCLEVRGG